VQPDGRLSWIRHSFTRKERIAATELGSRSRSGPLEPSSLRTVRRLEGLGAAPCVECADDLSGSSECSAIARTGPRGRPGFLRLSALSDPPGSFAINCPQSFSQLRLRYLSNELIGVGVVAQGIAGRELCNTITAAMYQLAPLRFGLNTGMEAAGIEPASAVAPS
jgi:hypothetical protein